ncbi:MAG: CheR family methyltransferase [Marinobacter sp.]|uniref:CheR family methyltransferase n=1 Tax=Marinobacter sp. TaxID=50741 RepID=UPI00299DB87F|nr:CheR family methyltransferase [Marinobacter sp.]MDX1756111.1 CheR family methyltransferase [Marinobacter sp.]
MSAHQEPRREFEYRRTDFEAIRRKLYQCAGISMADSKQQLVYSRIARRLRVLGLASFSDYLDFLQQHDEELEQFINALTTNLTAFFREAHHFDTLAQYLRQHAAPGRRFQLWCAAASTGEEPYSMAIAALEALGDNPPVSIHATDIDSRVLAQAAGASYPIERVKEIGSQRLKRFFLKGTGKNAGRVKVRREVRQLVRFSQLNLLAPGWPLEPPYDLIFCRNVMIYFDKPTQARLLDRMVPLLAPGGLYIAGHSESFSHVSKRIRLVGKTTYQVADGSAA